MKLNDMLFNILEEEAEIEAHNRQTDKAIPEAEMERLNQQWDVLRERYGKKFMAAISDLMRRYGEEIQESYYLISKILYTIREESVREFFFEATIANEKRRLESFKISYREEFPLKEGETTTE